MMFSKLRNGNCDQNCNQKQREQHKHDKSSTTNFSYSISPRYEACTRQINKNIDDIVCFEKPAQSTIACLIQARPAGSLHRDTSGERTTAAA